MCIPDLITCMNISHLKHYTSCIWVFNIVYNTRALHISILNGIYSMCVYVLSSKYFVACSIWSTHAYTHIYTYIFIGVFEWLCANMLSSMYLVAKGICARKLTHKHTHACTHTHTHTDRRQTHTNTQMHIHSNTQIHKYTNTQIHKYTYTHTYAHTHTDRQTDRRQTHTNTQIHIHTYTCLLYTSPSPRD